MATQQQNSQRTQKQGDDSAQIKSLFFMCLNKWHWFLISVIICMVIAYWRIGKTQPTYTRNAMVQIESDSKGKSFSNQLNSFNDLGMLRTTSTVDNELHAFQSTDIMHDVVEVMNLQYDYNVKGRLHTQTLYKESLPVNVEISGLAENDYVAFVLDIDGSDVVLTKLKKNKSEFSSTVRGKIGHTIATPIGVVKVNPTNSGKGKMSSQTIYVTRYGIDAATAKYMKKFGVSLTDKQADILTLSFEDVVPERAEDILNTIIDVYNRRWVEHKNVVTKATSLFIRERLALIESELSGVDEEISQYQSSNMIPDIKEAASMYMTLSSETEQQILQLNNEVETCKYLTSFLSKIGNDQLIPSIAGISAGGVDAQITKYNEMVIKRNQLVLNSSDENKIVQDLDEQISAMRQSIKQALNNQTVALNTQINNFRRSESTTNTKIENNPRQAKILLSVERQQQVKQSLYIFLLQKLEENELSQAFTAYNTRIIETPAGSSLPVSPKSMQIYLIAFVLGLCIPLGVIYMHEQLVSTVRGKRDIQDALTIPYLGEIPLYEQAKKFSLSKWLGLGKKKKQKTYNLKTVVKQGKRDVINEAFRVLRTNLEFLTTEENKVAAMTSYNVNSGKTFITMNLGLSCAINEKKVLLIDCDIRKSNLSKYVNSPKQGLTDYLAQKVNDYHDIIVQYADVPNLHILPCGTIPPNPTELIASPRFAELINKVRSEYQLVFLDCPPVEIVADTQIANSSVDRTIFVIRAGLLERSLLPEIEELYQEAKYKNMSTILNGTTSEGGRYGYKYGYKYGYRYGYRYGYHYGNSYGYGN